MLRTGFITESETNPKWQFEQESEASILGSHFAYSIAAIATGNKDKIANSKSKVKAFRKIFYEDPINNPPLNQASVSAGFDSWSVEEQIHWNQKGTVFPQAVRKFGVPPDVGPKKPVEFPYVFERPIKAYERKGEIRPFSKVKTISSQARLHYNPPERREERPLSPDKYRLPDPWAETSKPILGVVHETSAFKSKTERFSASGASRPSSSMDSRPHSPNMSMSKVHSTLTSSIDRFGTISPPEISQSLHSTSQITQSNPTITTNGAPGAENLQLGVNPSLSLSHSRPRTADTTKSSVSDPYSPRSFVKMKRAQSADTIRKNKVAGHTFAKFPRNTSEETKRIITKILTDPKLKRSTSELSETEETPQLNRFGLDLRIDIQPLNRNLHSNSFPTTPSHPSVYIEPPLLFDDDIASLPMSGIATSKDELIPDNGLSSSPKHSDHQQHHQSPMTRSNLKKEEEIPEHHFVAALNQPTIMPLRDSRPMCYSKKSFKDLFEFNHHHNPSTERLRSSLSTPTLRTKSRSPLYNNNYNHQQQRNQNNNGLSERNHSLKNLSSSFDDYDYSPSPRRSPRKLNRIDRTPSPQGKSKLVAAQLYTLHQQRENSHPPTRQPQQIQHPLTRKSNNRIVKSPTQKVVRIRLNVPIQKKDS